MPLADAGGCSRARRDLHRWKGVITLVDSAGRADPGGEVLAHRPSR
jgi:hypothetical protein